MSDPKVYLMVPKKLVVTWVFTTLALISLILGVAIWSNQQWCGIVTIFNDTYQSTPPPTASGKQLAIEFDKLRSRFLCK